MLKGVLGREERAWWLVAAIVIAADQATKWLARELLEGRPAAVITPFLKLQFDTNPGAAFSLLAGTAGARWLFVGIALAAAVLISVLIRRYAGERLFCFGLALILGGDLGNLIDRLAYGYVVDFVSVHARSWFPTLPPFPTFNVADSAITVGAVLVLLDSLRRRPSRSAQRG